MGLRNAERCGAFPGKTLDEASGTARNEPAAGHCAPCIRPTHPSSRKAAASQNSRHENVLSAPANVSLRAVAMAAREICPRAAFRCSQRLSRVPTCRNDTPIVIQLSIGSRKISTPRGDEKREQVARLRFGPSAPRFFRCFPEDVCLRRGAETDVFRRVAGFSDCAGNCPGSLRAAHLGTLPVIGARGAILFLSLFHEGRFSKESGKQANDAISSTCRGEKAKMQPNAPGVSRVADLRTFRGCLPARGWRRSETGSGAVDAVVAMRVCTGGGRGGASSSG